MGAPQTRYPLWQVLNAVADEVLVKIPYVQERKKKLETKQLPENMRQKSGFVIPAPVPEFHHHPSKQKTSKQKNNAT